MCVLCPCLRSKVVTPTSLEARGRPKLRWQAVAQQVVVQPTALQAQGRAGVGEWQQPIQAKPAAGEGADGNWGLGLGGVFYMFSMCWACWAGVRLEQILCWAYPGKWEKGMNTGYPGLKRDPANTSGIPPQSCPVPLTATPKPYPVPLPDNTVPLPDLTVMFSYNSKYGINMGKQTGGNRILSIRFHH
jgi:hypothetical protein